MEFEQLEFEPQVLRLPEDSRRHCRELGPKEHGQLESLLLGWSTVLYRQTYAGGRELKPQKLQLLEFSQPRSLELWSQEP